MGKRAIFWIVAIVLVTTSAAWGKVIYVDDDAPAGGDGTSWATAYRFLQDGLAHDAMNGDEVRVGQGLYKPDRKAVWPEEGDGDREASFVVPEGVVLRGGYAGVGAAEPNAWDADLYETILSGDLAGDDAAIDDPSLFLDEVSREDNSRSVVATGPATVLEGLVITGGHACSGRGSPDVVPARGFNGAGIWIEADDVTVRNCRLHQNFAEQGGGGILCNEAKGVVLEQCIVEGNGVYGVVGGGGLCAWRSSATVEACLFSNNWARYWGGG